MKAWRSQIAPGGLLLLLAACSPTAEREPLVADLPGPPCESGETYLPDPAEPMALGEVLAPYRWPVAIHRATGERAALDLGKVPCALAPEIDWSPFDLLLFISVPAW